ncbi:MAG: oligosaccharide flippase family protein [Megasphaera sp.]|uniref:oligosaccharide flippase family protein n=1 Tax=Megasphaera sp. TaxID=2023260 RepID=UPI003F0D03A3
MSKSISKNYIYNVSYQLLTLITPFITTPYLSRVLGPHGIGIYSYTTSIVSYFILLSSLGIANYAQREIAYNQDNPQIQSRTFFEINLLRIILVSISLGVYYLTIIHFPDDHLVYWIQALNIIAVLFDISWFFQGLEEFGKIVFRNFVIKVLSVVLIFVLIHNPDDLNKYIFLLGFMNILSGISIWFYLPRYLVKVPWKEIKIFRNFSIIIQLFLPQVAIQIYTVLDKTMIGAITGSPLENGYYEQAEKVVKLSLTIVTSLGTVMMPRIAYSYAHGKIDAIKEDMMRSYRFVWFLTIPMFFGFIAVSSNFVPWFFGPGYEKVVPLMQILSGLVIAIGLSNVTGIQYLLPTNQQNKLTLSVVIGAITNFVLNLLLIPHLQSIGAAIASIIAECVVTGVQFYIVRNVFSIVNIIASMKKYFISGCIMFAAIFTLAFILPPSIIHTFIIIAIGLGCYLGLLSLLKDSMLYMAINKIKNKVR